MSCQRYLIAKYMHYPFVANFTRWFVDIPNIIILAVFVPPYAYVKLFISNSCAHSSPNCSWKCSLNSLRKGYSRCLLKILLFFFCVNLLQARIFNINITLKWIFLNAISIYEHMLLGTNRKALLSIYSSIKTHKIFHTWSSNLSVFDLFYPTELPLSRNAETQNQMHQGNANWIIFLALTTANDEQKGV